MQRSCLLCVILLCLLRVVGLVDAKHPSLAPAALGSAELPPAQPADAGPDILDAGANLAGNRGWGSARNVFCEEVPGRTGDETHGVAGRDLGRGVVAQRVPGVSEAPQSAESTISTYLE